MWLDTFTWMKAENTNFLLMIIVNVFFIIIFFGEFCYCFCPEKIKNKKKNLKTS